jgi:hypothetical protein
MIAVSLELGAWNLELVLSLSLFTCRSFTGRDATIVHLADASHLSLLPLVFARTAVATI